MPHQTRSKNYQKKKKTRNWIRSANLNFHPYLSKREKEKPSFEQRIWTNWDDSFSFFIPIQAFDRQDSLCPTILSRVTVDSERRGLVFWRSTGTPTAQPRGRQSVGLKHLKKGRRQKGKKG